MWCCCGSCGPWDYGGVNLWHHFDAGIPTRADLGRIIASKIMGEQVCRIGPNLEASHTTCSEWLQSVIVGRAETDTGSILSSIRSRTVQDGPLHMREAQHPVPTDRRRGAQAMTMARVRSPLCLFSRCAPVPSLRQGSIRAAFDALPTPVGLMALTR